MLQRPQLDWLLVICVVVVTISPSGRTSWIRGEVRLNLRSGPGYEYRVLGTVKTGHELVPIERLESWAQVRTEKNTLGYIPDSYLTDEPPPVLRLTALET